MVEDLPVPVYGPGRYMTAMSAFAELREALRDVAANCHGWADYDSPRARRRLARAQAIREQYSEYGDSFLDQ